MRIPTVGSSSPPPDPTALGELLDALAESQRLGMLGTRPLPEVVEHAHSFVDALAGTTGTVVDLGAGGGVPGLVIAVARADLRLVLVDRRTARTDHLARLVRRLRLGDRVSVVAGDAATLTLPSPADAVVARGFGPPATTARVAVPLLERHGLLVVSEPPAGSPDRWPDEITRRFGLVRRRHADARVAVFELAPPPS